MAVKCGQQKADRRAFTLQGVSAVGGAQIFAITQPPAFGTITGRPPNLTCAPMANFTGNDPVYFTVSNGSETSLPAQAILEVCPDPNDAMPPQFITSTPANGGRISSRAHALRAEFSEAIDSLMSGNYLL